MEQERDLLQPRPYWKEFRFDLTPLPQGETVTAAEFRIYKTLTMGQRANRTLHISVYEIQRENRHRFGLFLSVFIPNFFLLLHYVLSEVELILFIIIYTITVTF